MKIFVKAKPGAKQEKITVDGTHLTIAVKEPPKDGKANAAIIRVLADHFNVPPATVQLISGFSSKNKVFEIMVH